MMQCTEDRAVLRNPSIFQPLQSRLCTPEKQNALRSTSAPSLLARVGASGLLLKEAELRNHFCSNSVHGCIDATCWRKKMHAAG